MTTAHRPTFHAAIGGKEQGGGRYIAGVSRVHVHDLAGQMTLKTRVPGQGTAEEMSGKDLRAELEEREAEHLKAIGKAPADVFAETTSVDDLSPIEAMRLKMEEMARRLAALEARAS